MNIITRKQYMANEVSHDEYYGQPAFRTPEVKSLVAQAIGIGPIVKSTDPYFNDIPLRRWDALHTNIIRLVGTAIAEANDTGGISLSDTVCIAKAAARQLKETRQ